MAKFLFARRAAAVLLLACLIFSLLPAASVSAQGSAGYRDFSFPTGTGGATRGPTGEKPESKLWWVDGTWYGTMWSSAANSFTIYRFVLASQSWVDTGVKVDDRLGSKADALWTGAKLYIASHLFIENAATAAPAGQRGELYRYSYNAASKTFSLDSGFPVEVNGGKTETLVIDRDSNGTLWVTYVQDLKVMVNHSLNGNDTQWGTPYVLPAGGMETVTKDDISSLIVYNNHVGVMWSRQTSPMTMYFAVHPINASDSTWTKVRSYTVSGDDHINLKTLEADSAGNVFAVIKTNNNSALIVLLVCKNNLNRCQSESDWTPYTVYNNSMGEPTRPMMMIDETNRELYVFARVEPTGTTRGGIYYKKTSLDTISFNASTIGTMFINNTVDFQVDDATSTKQNVTAASGLLVLASDPHSLYYLHNYIALGGGTPPAPPTISGFTPASGPPGTQVTINGSNFNGASAVTFNNTAASFVVNSASQISATVPAAASSGLIRVTNTAGTAASSGSFTVTTPAHYTLTTAAQGSGQVALSPTGGVYDEGTVVTLTATPVDGWLFSGWQGDLTGQANPAQLTMTGNKSVTAVFAQQSGGGTVSYGATVTGGAVSASSVSSASMSSSGSDLFLAAVTSRNPTTVNSVSGLGLSWTLVARQCGARNVTMTEVWMAQGAASAGPVTASLASTVKSAAIAVSRYSGAATVTPVGAVARANTLGLNGACAGGTDRNSYSYTISTSTPGAVVYAAVSSRNRAHTPGAGYTERVETKTGSGSDMSTLAVVDQTRANPGAGAVSGSFSGTVDWTSVALEIRPSGGTPVPAPAISGFTPASGPAGTSVTINGSNLTGASAVAFNGTAATFSVVSDTQISATLPAGATSGAISVTTPGGTATSAASFTVTTPAPVISGFSPASGPVGSSVTISGSNLSGASAVKFNGTAAAYTVNSAAQITATVPSGASTGAISVTTAGGTATSTGSFTVTIAAPQISGFTPSSGPVGTQVTINGSGFTGASAVTFNGTAAAFTVNSAAQISATVPNGATTGAIAVTTPGGTATSAASFTISSQPPPTYTLTTAAQGSGQVTLSPAGGVYDEGTVVTLTAAPASGWLFSGWQGDLTGQANPAQLTMTGNKSVTAVFTQQSSGGGQVSYGESVSGSSLLASTVSSASISGSDLFLAAVTSRNPAAVTGVSGLGLTWTFVTRQCSARSATMVEIWMAQGTASPGAVTASFPAAVKTAVITVSRYSGASTATPVGAQARANTLGLDGACTGGTDTASYSFNITSTTPGAMIYSAVSMRNRTHTPGAGATERIETMAGSGGDVASIAVMDQAAPNPGTFSVNGSFSGIVDWSAVALEIKP